MSNATYLTAGQAAKQTGVSKPTISRAIAEGRLSASRREDGSWGIDPAELMRWKESYGHRHTPPNQSATPPTTPEATLLQVENARVTAELSGVKALLDAERQRAETAERDRDRWHSAFLALPRPEEPRSGLFGWLKGKKPSAA
ncbi:MAG: helix-turn-helix domain-containing protein [Hyphomicrobiaceae bacterium]|nr:MAG: helix-turn-helix domain-containing protein [Hyphomicrobiaceae bacterium]